MPTSRNFGRDIQAACSKLKTALTEAIKKLPKPARKAIKPSKPRTNAQKHVLVRLLAGGRLHYYPQRSNRRCELVFKDASHYVGYSTFVALRSRNDICVLQSTGSHSVWGLHSDLKSVDWSKITKKVHEGNDEHAQENMD